ncbi:MAG: GntR family transcriptional regulator [Deltaproteobacteria bacterium]|nr:GntR family transcriptional regulator [Deltaproteobacteria bacterium]
MEWKKLENGTIELDNLKALPKRKSAGQLVFEYLKQAIISGDISPGNRLVESRIADAIGVSRTPVREALHKLESQDFLKKLPAGGFVVLGLTRQDIDETFGIRSVLESYAARLVVENYTSDGLSEREKIIQKYQNCLGKSRVDELEKLNTEFHELLYTLSNSPKLIKMINDLKTQIYRFRHIILSKDKMAEQSNQDHILMVDAIRKHDADGVEKLVKEHILRGKAAVLELLEAGGGKIEKEF